MTYANLSLDKYLRNRIYRVTEGGGVDGRSEGESRRSEEKSKRYDKTAGNGR